MKKKNRLQKALSKIISFNNAVPIFKIILLAQSMSAQKGMWMEKLKAESLTKEFSWTSYEINIQKVLAPPRTARGEGKEGPVFCIFFA